MNISKPFWGCVNAGIESVPDNIYTPSNHTRSAPKNINLPVIIDLASSSEWIPVSREYRSLTSSNGPVSETSSLTRGRLLGVLNEYVSQVSVYSLHWSSFMDSPEILFSQTYQWLTKDRWCTQSQLLKIPCHIPRLFQPRRIEKGTFKSALKRHVHVLHVTAVELCCKGASSPARLDWSIFSLLVA